MERQVVEFSEDEFVIRSYQCVVQKSAFSKPSDGYLQVTNKRVIYANSTNSAGSKSLSVSEVPLEDVGSITSFVGRTLNAIGLLPYAILLTLLATVSGNILPEFITHWFFVLLLMVPYTIVWLMEKNILSQDLFDRILNNLEINKDGQRTVRKPGENLRKVLRTIFLIGLVLFVASVINNYEFARSLGFLRFAIPLVIFGYVYISIFGFNDEFGLFVSARSASGSGLTIKSNSFQALFGKASIFNPGKFIPTADSYVVARELGALVMDLQQAGDLAVEKWSERSSTLADSM